MSAHFDRALVLLRQSRPELAEKELRQELGSDPEHAMAHAVLGLCLARREEFEEATRAAEEAIGLEPDLAFAHYALGSILQDRHRLGEALAAVTEAIRLDPADADYYGLKAGICFGQRRWADALESAELGLALDAEHTGCNNMRAMALVKLGRQKEAGATLDAALARDPDNALTHANQGWAYLEKGAHRQALEHFREALRLDPQLEWARAGIVEALKARHLVYRLMLWYFLGMAKLGRTAQWAVIVGGYLGYRALSSLANANPELGRWIWPLLIVYIVFVWMTWTADALFNLLLRLNRFGRLTLSRDQIVASNWVGACLFLAVIMLALYLGTQSVTAPLGALTFGFLVLPLAATFHCEPGWPRRCMAVYTALLAVLGITGTVLFFLGENGVGPREGVEAVLYGALCFRLFGLGVLLNGLVANGLGMVQPRR